MAPKRVGTAGPTSNRWQMTWFHVAEAQNFRATDGTEDVRGACYGRVMIMIYLQDHFTQARIRQVILNNQTLLKCSPCVI